MAKRGLHEKRAIITGASSGIGWHLAKQLAAEGVSIVACARRAERLAELTAEIEAAGGVCVPVAGDITTSETRQALLETCQKRLGGLDILINNAGIGAMGRFDEASTDRIRTVFEVNFFAITELIRESLPTLKLGQSPIIVNMSSVLAHRAAPLKSEYCASKFALHGFSDAIRAELSGNGIDMLLVSPSTTDSEFFDSSIEDNTQKNWKSRGAMPPEVVAAKTIRAIKKGKHEIILTHGGRFIVWLDRLIPGIANRVMAKFGQ
ncbi:MAG: short-subunit dehydrogenase [Mariniblastus sp.]|jgi:short-subunit dehydrogenase